MAEITKCLEDDPNRCQAIAGSLGQCPNLAVRTDGGKYGEYCLAHGGNRFLQAEKQGAIRNYQLDKFKAKLSRHATSPAIKNLRDEIAILRMVLEERLNKCNDAGDLILQSGPISDMVMKINKVIESCHKLEGSMGQLIDKQAILQFASEVIAIIGEEEDREYVIEKIGSRIMKLVGNMGEE